MIAEARHVSHSPQINISHWTFFDDSDTWRDLIMGGFAIKATEVLRDVFSNGPPRIDLPFMWRDGDGIGGKCPEDPAMLYVALPLGENDDDPTWSISLEHVVDDMIDNITSHDTGKVHNKDQDTCHKLAARLRELADKLDGACGGDRPEIEIGVEAL